MYIKVDNLTIEMAEDSDIDDWKHVFRTILYHQTFDTKLINHAINEEPFVTEDDLPF